MNATNPSKELPIEPLWTKPDVCEYLNISIHTLDKWVSGHKIPHLRFNGTIRFDPSATRAWANGQSTTPAPAPRTPNRAIQLFKARVGT